MDSKGRNHKNMEITIGKNIRKYREANSLSQKDLSEKLYVTPQAISRWENDEVEPSLDTIKKMAGIFNVSIDELMNNEAQKPKEESTNSPAAAIIPVTAPSAPVKKQIGICSVCQRPIYDGESKSYRVLNQYTQHYSRGRRRTFSEWVYSNSENANEKNELVCSDCMNKHIQELRSRKSEEIAEANKKAEREFKRKKALGWSIFAGIVSFALTLLISFANYKNGAAGVITGSIFLSILIGYFFFATIFILVADNTWISDFFFDTALKGMVRLPGVIFNIGDGADGFIAFVVIKAIIAICGFLIALAFFLASFAFTGIFSMFGFPFSLIKLDED
jgi:transcriptional regulator with XRE-family HTH domain/uncharacterized membrane protein (DUF485 family)